ncbi:hypothetical protein SFRURICE_003493 [Spodoptera frugiperda]|nr:hypothetical protein SFRURICE_003493 [Spodoptera frugiperda]
MKCVNCGIAIQRLQRHLVSSLSARHQSRLSCWLSNAQTQPSRNNYVCHVCWMRAIRLPVVDSTRDMQELASDNMQDLASNNNAAAPPDVQEVSSPQPKNFLNFENVSEMPNHSCHYWTGLTVPQFLILFNFLPRLNVKQPKRALAIYLIKLRTGDSNRRLSTLFNIPRTTLELIMKKVRLCLNEICTQ